jgi:hypothetical protein
MVIKHCHMNAWQLLMHYTYIMKLSLGQRSTWHVQQATGVFDGDRTFRSMMAPCSTDVQHKH